MARLTPIQQIAKQLAAGIVASLVPLTLGSGTITASQPALTITQTWNAGAVVFVADQITITDTASAAGSLLSKYVVGAATVWSIRKDGFVTAAGGGTFGAAVLATTDNSYDLGAAGATRFRTGYFGTSVVTPAITVSGATTFNGNALTWPAGAGLSGYVLTTNGAGVLSWAAPGASAGTLTLGSFLTGTSYNGSANVTAAVDATTTNTASKVVARDGAGAFAMGALTVAAVNASGDVTITKTAPVLALNGSGITSASITYTTNGGLRWSAYVPSASSDYRISNTGGTDQFVMDQSGNVTIGGTLKLGGILQLGSAYAAGVVAATGTIPVKDSSGTTYNMLVHT